MSKQGQKDRPRLGRGLASLINVSERRTPQPPSHPPVAAHSSATSAGPASPASSEKATIEVAVPAQIAGGRGMDIPLASITPNPKQPRQSFSEAALAELAESMKTNGVIQPILVRPMGGEKYQLIAGERRWRAAQKAGLLAIPAIVREVDALTQAQLAMIENIQREDLNPIERAMGYQTLIKELGLTQAELAGRLGEDRSSIANFLRLLELAEPVRSFCGRGRSR